MTVGVFSVLLLSFIWFWRRTSDRNTRRMGFALIFLASVFISLYAAGKSGIGIPALLVLLTGGD